MRRALAAALLLCAAPLAAQSGTCDIATTPAATLLLPYFEVDVGHAPPARTTVVSIVNVSPRPAIARVTLWTDFGDPLLAFNVAPTSRSRRGARR